MPTAPEPFAGGTETLLDRYHLLLRRSCGHSTHGMICVGSSQSPEDRTMPTASQ